MKRLTKTKMAKDIELWTSVRYHEFLGLPDQKPLLFDKLMEWSYTDLEEVRQVMFLEIIDSRGLLA